MHGRDQTAAGLARGSASEHIGVVAVRMYDVRAECGNSRLDASLFLTIGSVSASKHSHPHARLSEPLGERRRRRSLRIGEQREHLGRHSTRGSTRRQLKHNLFEPAECRGRDDVKHPRRRGRVRRVG
jgi:hypothetical protein